MPKGMIISVGGSPEPIIKTIEEHRPEFICFFASQDTVEYIRDVKKALQGKDFKIRDKKIIVDNVNDLVHCYKRACDSLSIMDLEGILPEEIVVDYTGGTKTMTASLALAALTKGARFSYVGGEKRTKNGVGIVLNGFEKIEEGLSPWQLYAVDEKQRIAQYFNSYQFDAALSLISQIKSKVEKKQRLLFDKIEIITHAYKNWDMFNHIEAIKDLSSGTKGLKEYLEISGDDKLQGFYKKVKESLEFLEQLQKKTKQFHRLHIILVADLIANAARRAKERKFDDATARLYRALEMFGQIIFLKTFGCSSSEVPPEKIPEKLRDEYIARYERTENRLQLPLFATFRLLREKGNKYGMLFFEKEEIFKKLIDARNNSMLAHGLKSISENTFRKFLDLLVDIFNLKYLLEFPNLEW